ncbi:hypothetical protein EBQ93_00885, partial [bacterium]|nr:hypothetical protein [bacterium]
MSTHCVMFFVLMYVCSICAGSGPERAGVDDVSQFLTKSPLAVSDKFPCCTPDVLLDRASLSASSKIEMTGSPRQRVEDSASCCGGYEERTLGDEGLEECCPILKTRAGMDADDEGAATLSSMTMSGAATSSSRTMPGAARGGGAAAELSDIDVTMSEDGALYGQETPGLRSARESRNASPVPKSVHAELTLEEKAHIAAIVRERMTKGHAELFFKARYLLSKDADGNPRFSEASIQESVRLWLRNIYMLYEPRKVSVEDINREVHSCMRAIREPGYFEDFIQKTIQDDVERLEKDRMEKILREEESRRQASNLASFESMRSVPGRGPVVKMPWGQVTASSIDDNIRDYIRTKIQQNLSDIDHQVFDSHGVGADTEKDFITRIREYNVTSQLNSMHAFLIRPDIARLYDAAYDGCSEISGKDALVESKKYFNAIVSMHNDVVLAYNMNVLEY